MWDLIVSVPDHCLSFYFPLTAHDLVQMPPRMHNLKLWLSSKKNLVNFKEIGDSYESHLAFKLP